MLWSCSVFIFYFCILIRCLVFSLIFMAYIFSMFLWQPDSWWIPWGCSELLMMQVRKQDCFLMVGLSRGRSGQGITEGSLNAFLQADQSSHSSFLEDQALLAMGQLPYPLEENDWTVCGLAGGLILGWRLVFMTASSVYILGQFLISVSLIGNGARHRSP